MKRRLFFRTAVGWAAISAVLAMALATTGTFTVCPGEDEGLPSDNECDDVT